VKIKTRGPRNDSKMPPRVIIAILIGLFLLLSGPPAQSQSKTRAPIPEVPFELIQNQIVFQVKVGGKGPFNMVLDTSADLSAVDSATAKELGAAGRLSQLELGGLTVKDLPVGSVDLSKITALTGKPIQGVLGYSFLKDRIIQIDYPASKIRFFSESPYPGILDAANTVNRSGVAFRYDEGVLIDSVFINNLKVRAILDTGSIDMFALTPEGAAMLGLEAEGRQNKGDSANSETEKESMVLLKSVRLGRLSIDSAVAMLWPPGSGHDKKKFQVSIGNDFFKDFIMTFDFRGKIVVFERVE
jgi:Aspartyl protease